MDKLDPSKQEAIGARLIEDVSIKLHYSSGVGAATCQVGGSFFETGDTVVAYVFRPAGESDYQVGNILCANEKHALPTAFTLGVRELLVEGRVDQPSEPDSSPLVITVVLNVNKPWTNADIDQGDGDATSHQAQQPAAHPRLGGARR